VYEEVASAQDVGVLVDARIVGDEPSIQRRSPGVARASQMAGVTVLSFRDNEPRHTCVNRAILTVVSHEPDLERASRLRFPARTDGAGRSHTRLTA
jgi:hypothetical protein